MISEESEKEKHISSPVLWKNEGKNEFWDGIYFLLEAG